jgi:sn-glycerol 3-phosphate transport system ATP-binding protein
MAAIHLENVSKDFSRGVVGLDNLSLEVNDREILTVVGPSGCGKSTLLRLIAGLDSPTSGRIRIDGTAADSVSPRERNVAMVFQSYALYPHMTCYQNLALNLRLKKVSAAEIDRRVRETASMLEITDLLGKKPRELSGGQRQRVAVGRALIRKPRAFLLDEPLSNLDPLLRERVRHELRALFRKVEATVIYVTHDQTEALTLADRVAVLDHGRLQQVGTPEELYQKPLNRFVASFIGSPSMNFFETDLQDGYFSLGGGRYKTGVRVSRRVTIGIRPDALQEGSGGQRSNARVSWIEALGAHFLIGVDIDGKTLTALLRHRPSAEIICLSLDPAQIHVFDNQSGKNLRIDSADRPPGRQL